ncbi:MAG: outer membrane beta-barrel protein [Alphaproteobacteria bacterium]|nr:outer membrane beta-barrel protein [Alphaproteobacteria bacterium]
MQKKLLFLTAGFLSLTVAAPSVAADMGAPAYPKAPPFAVAIYDRSGLYVGLNGGGGLSHVSDKYGTIRSDGGSFGGQIGYRWQQSDWVLGLEGQGNWADFSGSRHAARPDAGADVTEDIRIRPNSFALFTGQVGYAIDTTLLFVKGGAAVVNDKRDWKIQDSAGHFATGSENDSSWGGTVGVGLEYAFAPNWSVGVEWDHLFLSRHNYNYTSVDNNGVSHNGTSPSGAQGIDIAEFRINYKFGSPAVARY